MKRGGELKRSDKPMANGGLPAPTKAQKTLFDALLNQIGCVVCLFYCRHPDGSRVEGSVGEIHHLLSGGNRISHWHVLPLCRTHHVEGKPGNPSRHSIMGQYGKDEFERTYATEMELVMQCEEWINQPYVTGLLSDEQAPQDDNRCPDTHADDQSDDGHARTDVEQMQAFDSPVHIRVTHYRARLCDPDNLNAKGLVDAIVKAGLLEDDSATHVKSITHDQIKVKSYDEEKTRITITEVAA